MPTISKLLFQCSKENIPEYVISMIKTKLTYEWKYLHFNDDNCITFFKEHPLPEFPDIINKFHSYSKGQHKSDIFRYYFLYVKGGVYMDSDAMIYEPIEEIIQNYSFFSVISSVFPECIFQGILGCSPNNPIIYDALVHAYHTIPVYLTNDYHYFCKYLYYICVNNRYNGNNILFREHRDINNITVDTIIDQNYKILFRHFHYYKIIPPVEML